MTNAVGFDREGRVRVKKGGAVNVYDHGIFPPHGVTF